ncbi:hypothetical protein ACX1C1_08535 [Paenibacillus sp. strain BS8-2]
MRSTARVSIFMIFFCLVSVLPVFADWASSIVVHDGSSYTVTEMTITEDRIGPEVGKVTKYSDMEGTYRGNFSNTFPKGTPYYAILDTSKDEAIAILTSDGRYILAVYNGVYPKVPLWTSAYFWIGVGAVVLGFMFISVWLANRKKREGR